MQLTTGYFSGDNPLFTNFVSQLTQGKAKKVNNNNLSNIEVKGKQNNEICKIFQDSLINNTQSVDRIDIERFKKNLEDSAIVESSLKITVMAITDSLINSQTFSFKEKIGGAQFKNSNDTKILSDFYKQFLEGKIDVGILFDKINKANVSGPAKKNAMVYLNGLGITENAPNSNLISSSSRQTHQLLDKFKSEVGGPAYKNSNNTNSLSELYGLYIEGKLNLKDLYEKIDKAAVSGPAKKNAKKYLESIHLSDPRSVPIDTKPATHFKLNSQLIKGQYANLKPLRNETTFAAKNNPGGAVNIGYEIHKTNPNAKIGVMVAANSGLPGGALGKSNHVITKNDLSMSTQEESVWANAVLTASQTTNIDPAVYHAQTIAGCWGMKDSKGTMTKQGIDFTTTQKAEDYNGVYLLQSCTVSQVTDTPNKTKDLVKSTHYPVVMAFADSINANQKIGTPEGTMQRTLNKKAVKEYDFFRECVKEKLRSALDGMAGQGVTHSLVARLSCGIYAGDHKARINNEFDNILKEILEEPVGPNGEKRGCYFQDVIIAGTG